MQKCTERRLSKEVTSSSLDAWTINGCSLHSAEKESRTRKYLTLQLREGLIVTVSFSIYCSHFRVLCVCNSLLQRQQFLSCPTCLFHFPSTCRSSPVKSSSHQQHTKILISSLPTLRPSFHHSSEISPSSSDTFSFFVSFARVSFPAGSSFDAGMSFVVEVCFWRFFALLSSPARTSAAASLISTLCARTAPIAQGVHLAPTNPVPLHPVHGTFLSLFHQHLARHMQKKRIRTGEENHLPSQHMTSAYLARGDSDAVDAAMTRVFCAC